MYSIFISFILFTVYFNAIREYLIDNDFINRFLLNSLEIYYFNMNYFINNI